MSETVERLEFSLKLEQIPVTLVSKEGTKSEYVLSAFDGESRDTWFDYINDRMQLTKEQEVKPGTKKEEDTKVKFKRFQGVQAKLVGMCLFNSDNVAVSEAEILKFPAVVLSKLFDHCQKMNALDEPAKAKAKNE